MANLDELFTDDQDFDSYRFALSTVEPTGNRDTLVDALAEMMDRNKCDPQVTADLIAAAGWDIAMAPLRRGNLAVRRGDFSEMLAAEAAEALDGLQVPVRKLRYQIDPNQTLPGSDVVAFKVDRDGSINELEFIESKFRHDPPSSIAVEAHTQLAADREKGFATTLSFLASRLRELDSEMYKAFLDYLCQRSSQDGFHTIVLTFDEALWDEVIAENLDDLPHHLPELWLRRFPFEGVAELVEDVYAELLWDVIDDD